MGLLFLKTSPVKKYSYENDFSGVFDALHQTFLVHICRTLCRNMRDNEIKQQWRAIMQCLQRLNFKILKTIITRHPLNWTWTRLIDRHTRYPVKLLRTFFCVSAGTVLGYDLGYFIKNAKDVTTGICRTYIKAGNCLMLLFTETEV